MIEQLIRFDRAKLERLKKRMKATEPAEQFEFEGATFLRSYAKYVVEYLEGKLT